MNSKKISYQSKVHKKETLLNFTKRVFAIYHKNILNEALILLTILGQREKSALTIQKSIRRFFRRREINTYFQRKRNFYLIPFNAPAKTINQVYLEILLPENYQIKYVLQYSKFTDLYVAYLPRERYKLMKEGILYFRFIENEKYCIDPHYEIVSDMKRSVFYNLIDIYAYEFLESMEKIKLKNFVEKIKLHEKEDICKRYKKKIDYLKITKHLKRLINPHLPIMAK